MGDTKNDSSRATGFWQKCCNIIKRFFRCPVKAEPLTFALQRHYNSSALGSPEHAHQHRHDLTDTRDWPGWTVHTLQYLYNLFVLYFNRDRGRMEESRASALCEDLGDRSARHERRARFANSDRMWRKTERGEKLPEQPEEPEDEQLLEKLRQLLKAPDAAMEEAEEGAAKAAAEVEEARNSLRPLARSVYEMSRRAEHLRPNQYYCDLESYPLKRHLKHP
ncbi:Protein of unknown function [Gryllus bimaculatus]|nr:Protein of unknown function [Gryllus bimaculatus]